MSAQSMDALNRANEVRYSIADVRAELRCGVLSVADALRDDRAQRMQIGRLLCAQRAWGPTKSQHLLGRLQIWPTRRVQDLTDRQRHLITGAIK